MKYIFFVIIAFVLIVGCVYQEPFETKNIEKVSVDELSKGPRRYHNFSDEFKTKVNYLQQTFKEVDNSSYEVWLDDFDRDRTPESELELWLHMAKIYKKMIEKYPYPNEVYKVIIAWSVGLEYEEIMQEDFNYLDEKNIQEILFELNY